MGKNIVVAIDGHSGCGKSSTAKAVARKLNYTYIDSGAMYRAATLFLFRRNIGWEDNESIKELVGRIEIDFEKDSSGNFITQLNGENVEDEIRNLDISNLVSQYSMVPELRKAMVDLQRRLSKDRNVIMDGRDIGTVVFPDADLKLFMTAELDVRAHRRQKELKLQGKDFSLEEVISNLSTRDDMDTTREQSPLMQAPDAVIVDTTHLSLEEQIEMVAKMARKKEAKFK